MKKVKMTNRFKIKQLFKILNLTKLNTFNKKCNI